jgi:hypothetical protein
LACAIERRKFRADPSYPTARAAGSSSFALIRPAVFSVCTATRSATTSKFRSRGRRIDSGSQAAIRASCSMI